MLRGHAPMLLALILCFVVLALQDFQFGIFVLLHFSGSFSFYCYSFAYWLLLRWEFSVFTSFRCVLDLDTISAVLCDWDSVSALKTVFTDALEIRRA